MTSAARFDSSGLSVQLDWRGMVFGLSRREFCIPKADVVSVKGITSKEAAQLLRFRLAGTAVPGWWLMGWFSRASRDGRRAWVWITPKRNLFAFETTQRNRSLVILPSDWFVNPPDGISGGEDALRDR